MITKPTLIRKIRQVINANMAYDGAPVYHFLWNIDVYCRDKKFRKTFIVGVDKADNFVEFIADKSLTYSIDDINYLDKRKNHLIVYIRDCTGQISNIDADVMDELIRFAWFFFVSNDNETGN